MCLAIPLEILKIKPDSKAEAGSGGASCSIDISLIPDIKEGDFVIVHAGFAIEKLDKEEAGTRIELFRELAEIYESSSGMKG